MTTWRLLPESVAAEAAAAGFALRDLSLPRGMPPGRGLRYAQGDVEIDVPDPGWVSDTAGAWCALTSLHRQHPEHEAWKMAQALANRRRWTWGVARGSAAGQTVHVVGNGPSARKALGQVGPDDVVIAINGALLLREEGLPVTFWSMGDACLPSSFGGDGTLHDTWAAAMLEHGLGDVDLVASPFSYAPLVAACRSVHTWLGCHGPPFHFYRHLVPEGTRLLTLVNAPSTAPTMVHLAWWLGAREVVLWGLDCGVPGDAAPDEQPLHAAMTALDAANPILTRRAWRKVAGYDGDVWTCSVYDGVRRALEAVCLFAMDAGVAVTTGAGCAKLTGVGGR